MWDFGFKEQAYQNNLPGKSSLFKGISFFIKKCQPGQVYIKNGYMQMKLFVLSSLMIFTYSAFAQDCFEMAGRDYRIEPDLLRAISFRESSWRDEALNVVSATEYSVGLMQIHSKNFSHLAQFGITPRQLYTDSCLNIYSGAYYLAISFKRWGYSWRAVGAYNAGFRETEEQERRRKNYAQEIQKIYISIKKNAPSQ